ncbi:Bacterial PH domain protein [uncultured archaeon]|nr:Bacterial PH domain protein [uncultured archaeon]
MAEARHLDKRVTMAWLFPTALAIAAIWLVASVAYLILPPDGGMFGIPKVLFPILLLLALALLGALPMYLWIQLVHNSFTYEVGESEIIIREGVITRKTTVIPYSKIQDITSERTFIERMLGIATIEIETAGSSRIASEIKVPGIANKDELISEIMLMVDRNKGRAEEKQGKDAAAASELLMGEVLKELKLITSKLDALGAQGGRNGEKKELHKEKPDMFEPLGHEEGFRRFRKK